MADTGFEATEPNSNEAPSSEPTPAKAKGRGMGFGVLGTLLAVLVGGWTWVSIRNRQLNAAVQSAVDSDSRNFGLRFEARYEGRIHFRTLELELATTGGKAPIEVLRALLQTAERLTSGGDRFEKVCFTQGGVCKFVMSGSDFHSMGSAFGAGENPLYLIRTLPAKIETPSGDPAFSRWTGGLLGVFSREMGDAASFARTWAGE